MRPVRGLLAAALCLGAGLAYAGAAAPGTDAAGAAAAAESAWNAFLAGDLESVAASYRYLSTLGTASPDPDANLALMARDRGLHDEAVAAWVKTSVKDDARGFVWNQRGWSYAALDRLSEARSSFLKALDRSATTADSAESQLGLAVSLRLAAEPKKALAPLRTLLEQNPFDQNAPLKSPYIMAAANSEAARTTGGSGDRYPAMAYLRQCLSLDPRNLECLKDLAELQSKVGENRAAWYSYQGLEAMDPADAEFPKQVKRLRQFITGDPEAALPIRRLGRPLLPPQAGEDAAGPAGPTLRVGLFTAPDGRPATALRAYFVTNSDFKIVAQSGDVVKDDGRAMHQWEVAYRPENNLVELRDNARNIVYTTKQSFRIIPSAPQPSVLVKNVRLTDPVGLDIGDREVRGGIEVIPNPYGFKLVNEVGLEEYLYGAVSVALPHGSDSEAYKAQAVVSRTRALWFKAHRAENLERTDICDAEACQKYLGLSEEMQEAGAAVRATAGITLTQDGEAVLVLQHDNCGGVTENGRDSEEPGTAHLLSVSDGERPVGIGHSPLELELWMHEYPGQDRYCEASGITPPAESRWVRFIPAAAVTARARRVKDIGPVRHLRVLSRTSTSRVKSLEVVGSRGSVRLDGFKAIASVLSPGSLRSTLFTVQPLMAGSKAESFILWGAGTGHGVGLCRAGLLGQARMGRKWPVILSHYFPNLKLMDPFQKHLAPEPAKLPVGHFKKPKNPRWNKKQQK
ncbi:MAG: SpoIID/LytB domain-containing protein [Elusimicrobia bacterium]|nr:SpoIID/LytB domain-containing protein [Elusimicrobiota bacterium]